MIGPDLVVNLYPLKLNFESSIATIGHHIWLYRRTDITRKLEGEGKRKHRRSGSTENPISVFSEMKLPSLFLIPTFMYL
jgi:hypothetical protein